MNGLLLSRQMNTAVLITFQNNITRVYALALVFLPRDAV